MTHILGINAWHGDSSAALIRDGELIAAVEEERFTRVKHWAGFPAQSIRYCLREGGIGPNELDHVALSFNPRANLGRKLAFTIRNVPQLSAVLDRLKRQSKSANVRARLAEALDCDAESIRAEIHKVEHHLAHAAHAFFLSPFDRAAILSIDGMGDFTSTLLASGRGNAIEVLDRIYYPHSIGFLYNAVTLYLGFPSYGDEYKVMGLAPYGRPEYMDEFRQIVSATKEGFELNLDYFVHHRRGVSMSWDGGAPRVDPFHSDKMEELLEHSGTWEEGENEVREKIAASLQSVTEEIAFHLLNRLHEIERCDAVCLSGGVAMNSVINGKIHRRTPFREIYVPVGAADNGTAIGAAFHVWHERLKQPRKFSLRHAFWGPAYEAAECEAALRSKSARYERLEEAELVGRVVEALTRGEVVGWYQGRMEFGARALGHRSLLADPRRADMRDIINQRIKFREKFRPFAPSILEERVGEYFEDAVSSPFMEKVIPIRPEKRGAIPAVTHVDGTGRLQTVDRETNALYWRLIDEFGRETGIPIVLNTSLNENEPIVCSPGEALDCFLRTSMDAMALGPYYVRRSEV